MGYLAAPAAGGDQEVAGPAHAYADVDTAAAEYLAILAARAAEAGAVDAGTPAFDVLLLGLGTEGHVASIFPESPAVFATEPVVAVHDCPKPPPTRVSLTLPTIQRARDVWVVSAGEAKAEAVALALFGAPPSQVPAAGAVGTEQTLWLLDRAAASRLPDR